MRWIDLRVFLYKLNHTHPRHPRHPRSNNQGTPARGAPYINDGNINDEDNFGISVFRDFRA